MSLLFLPRNLFYQGRPHNERTLGETISPSSCTCSNPASTKRSQNVSSGVIKPSITPHYTLQKRFVLAGKPVANGARGRCPKTLYGRCPKKTVSVYPQ